MPSYLSVFSVLILSGCATLGAQFNSATISDYYQLGNSAYLNGDYQQAQSQWEKGLLIANGDNELNSWDAKFNLSLAQLANYYGGEYDRALELADQGLTAATGLADISLQAEAHAILGAAYLGKLQFSEAEDHSKKALEIAREIKNLSIQSESTRNRGAILKKQDKYDLAKSKYQESLDLALKANDKLLQAKALNNLGELSLKHAQYKEARDQFNQSLQLRKVINDYIGQAKTLDQLCSVHQYLNKDVEAQKNCNEALIIARAINQKADEAMILNNIANIYKRHKKLKEAEDYYRQSLSIKQEMNDLTGEAHTLNNLAEIFRSQNNQNKALEYYKQALDIQKKIKDRSGQSSTYCNIGITYSLLSQHNKALDNFYEALKIQNLLREPDKQWRIYANLSDAFNRMRYLGTAITFGKLAVNTIQSIRATNQDLNKQEQNSYLNDKRKVYEQLANLLIDQGRLPEAQQVWVMLKEEEYFEFIRGDNKTDPKSIQANYTVKEDEFIAKLTGLFEKGQEIDELAQKESLTAQESDQKAKLDKSLEDIRESFYSYIEALKNNAHSDKDVEKLATYLDNYLSDQTILKSSKDTVLIRYYHGEMEQKITLTTSNGSLIPKVYKVPLTNEQLNHKIDSVLTKIKNKSDLSKEANELYKHLIEPLKADLDSLNSKTLVISSSGALRYLPFSILYDGTQYLSEHYAIAMLNDAVRNNGLTEKPNSSWKVAGFGVSESKDNNFNNLPAVQEELDAIVKERNSNQGILPGKKYINLAFTPEQLSDTLRQKRIAYPVLHLASHFKLDPGSDKDSFLLAGGGAHISLHDLNIKDYQLSGKNLVTLSACETALAVNNDNGDEVEGLGALIQKKQAHAVLATLWSVNDLSTAKFMVQFYQLREKNHLTKAEAIQQAQIKFIRGEIKNEGSSEKRNKSNCIPASDLKAESLKCDQSSSGESPAKPLDYKHPYYWAPFILMGNWQ
jgi:CHAT domain-containing protein/tetratricopeptide (TPR) repeat protein